MSSVYLRIAGPYTFGASSGVIAPSSRMCSSRNRACGLLPWPLLAFLSAKTRHGRPSRSSWVLPMPGAWSRSAASAIVSQISAMAPAHAHLPSMGTVCVVWPRGPPVLWGDAEISCCVYPMPSVAEMCKQHLDCT